MQYKSTTINNNGQITIPKAFREHLKSKTVILQIDDDNSIKITPLPKIGGCLSKYARKDLAHLTFNEIRELAWEKVAEDYVKEEKL